MESESKELKGGHGNEPHLESFPEAGLSPAAIPEGVQAYLGPEVDTRRWIQNTLESVYRGWDYREIILPLYDYLETFSQGMGSELAGRTFRFTDRDGTLVALRPDLTTLVAKTAATRLEGEALPLRLYYRGEVFRHEPPKAGRQRVFTQVGLELIGSPLLASDLEILLIADECLQRLGVSSHRLVVGHADFFAGIQNALQLEPRAARDLVRAVDHKDASALERIVQSLDIAPDKKEFLVALPHLSGGEATLRQARSVVRNAQSRRALEELEQVSRILAGVGRQGSVVFDLSEVRGLEYYTGLIFKVYSSSLGFELGGGGRYDNLLESFGRRLPAIGFSFSEDRLAACLAPFSPAAEGRKPQTVRISEKPRIEEIARVLELRSQDVHIRMEGPPRGVES